MPLVVATLQAQLAGVMASPPATALECGKAWADAVQAYAASIVPPSATVAAAAQALAAALGGAFSATGGLPLMDAAFAAFAAALGGGMAGYAAVPPPLPIGFAVVLASPASTHAEAAQRVAQAIDAWMRTGTATLIPPPFTVTPWS